MSESIVWVKRQMSVLREMSMKIYIAFAVLMLGLGTSAVAEGHSHIASAHMRPQLFHDRTPHVHLRTVQHQR